MNALRFLFASLVLLAFTACNDSADMPQIEAEAKIAVAEQSVTTLWPVPYISQRDYPGIAGSACGPTSVTMLLRYFFPDIKTDVPEVYHGGTQSYNYVGPVVGYQNISAVSGDSTISAVPATYQTYYSSSGYTGATPQGLVSYLKNVWGLSADFIDSADVDTFYEVIDFTPVLIRTYGHGNVNWGHWMVATGVDEKGTANRTDDEIIVHDPYGCWNRSWDTSDGRARRISYHDFFVAGRYGQPWYRGMIYVNPPSQKAVYVADNATPNYAGGWAYSALNKSAWQERYRDADSLLGDFVYVGSTTQSLVGNQWFIWPTVIRTAGWYDITAAAVGSNTSGQVVYSVQRCITSPCEWRKASRVVDQYRATTQRMEVHIARAYLTTDDVVVASVPVSSAVDAIRFVPAAAPKCANRCADYGYATTQCQNGWYCAENGCLGWQGSDSCTCRYTCSAYGYRYDQCSNGWRCRVDGCLQYEGTC